MLLVFSDLLYNWKTLRNIITHLIQGYHRSIRCFQQLLHIMYHLLADVFGPALGLMVGGAHLLPLHGAVLLQGPPGDVYCHNDDIIVTFITKDVTCTF